MKELLLHVTLITLKTEKIHILSVLQLVIHISTTFNKKKNNNAPMKCTLKFVLFDIKCTKHMSKVLFIKLDGNSKNEEVRK